MTKLAIFATALIMGIAAASLPGIAPGQELFVDIDIDDFTPQFEGQYTKSACELKDPVGLELLLKQLVH